MTDSKKVANYSPAQEAAILAAAPLNLEKAKEISAQIGKSYRSVISKAKQLGVPYEVKAAAKKRVGGVTKAALVEKLEARFGVSLDGLEKSTAKPLASMVAYFDAIEAAEEDGE